MRGVKTSVLAITFLCALWAMALEPSWAQTTQGNNVTQAENATQGETARTVEELDLFSLLWRGGWVMIPIAVASILALTLTIERFISLRRCKIVPEGFIKEFKSRFESRGIDEKDGLAFCEKQPSVISNLVRSAIPKIKRGAGGLQSALEDAGAREVDRMKRSLKPLSMIATIAPLLGLLGTVYGMIGAFQAASGAGLGKSDVLAQGIYEALVTTAAGLTLAIPVLIVYMALNQKIDAMVDVLDDRADEFLSFVLETKTEDAI